MKTRLHKFLSIFLVSVMLLTAAPLSGFVGLDLNLDWLNLTTKASETTYNGECGENVNWNLDAGTGELVLSGTGPTYDYDYINFMEEASWSKYSELIKTVVVEEGITAIGKFIFNTLPNFTSIVLPDSLRRIGNAAFNECEALVDITIGDNVSEIGNGAFEDTVFYSDQSNWENGVLYLNNYLIDVKSSVTGDFVVKENTTLIGRRAFQYRSGIKSVTFPISLLYINQDAFEECTGITAFNYPGTLEQWNLVSVDYGNGNYGKGNDIIKKYLIIGTDSGSSQYLSGRYGANSTWTLYGNGELLISGSGAPYSNSSSGDSWEQHISKIKKVTINDGITGIKAGAFKDCENLVEVTLPESVTVIWHSAFENCTSLKSITIPSKVKNIYGGTFCNCTSLENITILGEIETVESEAFRNTALPFDGNELYIQGHLVELKESIKGHYTVRDGTIGIGGSVFEGMKEMTSITIPEGVKYIGNDAFLNCSGLTELTIPEGCATIYDYAFCGCKNLEFLKLPTSITYVECDDAFASLSDTKILYPGTESQWKSISWGYYSLSNDYFDCLILECDSDRPYYRVSKCGNNAYAKLYTDGELLIYGYGEMRSDIYDEYMGYESFSWTWQYKKSEIMSITVSEGITYIHPSAFTNCPNIVSISLPVSLRTIDTNAFANSKIETVYFAGSVVQWNAIGYNDWGSSTPEVVFGVSHEHYYSTEVTKEPTCTSTGMVLYSCACGRNYTEVLPMAEHTLEIYHLEPTCVNQGYECDKCSACGEEFNHRNYEDVVDHIWGNEYVVPTCSQEGYHCLRCSVCSEQKDVTTLPRLQHTPLEWVILSEPTCEERGVEIQRCTVCLTEVDRAEISALGHKAGDWEIISEATCTGKGVAVQKCVNCKTEIERVESSALGHEAGEWTVEAEPTCQNDGLKVQRCVVCTEIINSEVLPSNEHISSGWVILSEPTCKEGGVMVQNCKICNVEIERLKTSALEHTLGAWFVETETTCKTEGLKVQKCTVCSEVVNSEVIPKLAHTPGEWQVETEATCDHIGLNVQRCLICSQIIDSEEIPSPSHTPGEWELVREADCENSGLSIKKCLVCLNEIERAETPQKGHNPGGWVVEAEPSCTSYGLNVQRCLTCNKIVDNSIILKTPHTLGEWVVETEPTCTQAGTAVQNCLVCYNEINREEIPVLDHQTGEWTIETEATCSQTGLKVKNCNTCKEVVESEEIPALDHISSDWEADTAPTCQHVGFEVQKCTVCSKILKSRTIPKLSHTYSEWTVITEPTTTQTGEKTHRCTACSSVERLVISPTGFEPVNGLQIDFANDLIYGLDVGCVSLDDYSNLLISSYSWSYTTSDGRLGTGSKAVLTRGSTYSEYTIVIFGDVNGDGWYDGTDSIIVSCIANGLLTAEDVSEAAYKAADCNHDGVIDSLDVGILRKAGLLRADVDQSKSSEELATDEAFIEYLDLIDQTPEDEIIEDEVIETPEEEPEVPETEEFSIFEFIIEMIKKFIEFILSHIPVPYK